LNLQKNEYHAGSYNFLIETDGATSDNLDTRVSFYGQYGVNWNNKRMPLLTGNDYKSYLSDIGMTYFGNMEGFFSEFPFLSDPNSKYNYLYNNTTDWQDEIYKNGFVTPVVDNCLSDKLNRPLLSSPPIY